VSAALAHRPRKRFGQHFLRDPGVLERIVAAIRPVPGDHLVEIGPGLGALTRPLLAAVGELDAVELDRDLLEPLRAHCADIGRLRLHHADALKFDFAALRGTGPRLRVAGNLPYNISTPLLFHLLNQASHLRDLHFMLQQDVVERMAAGPGEEAYGRLSVMNALRGWLDIAQIEAAGVDPGARPETLDLAAFAALSAVAPCADPAAKIYGASSS